MKKSSGKELTETSATRRRTERLEISVPISIRITGSDEPFHEQSRTLDLSRGGVSFTARQSYFNGMNLQLSFIELQNISAEVREIPVQVVRVSKMSARGEMVVAVHFADLDRANLALAELLRARMRTSSAFLDIVRAISPGREIGAVIEDICRTTKRAMEAEKVLLFSHCPEQRVLRLRARVAGGAEETHIGLGEGLVGEAARDGRLINVSSLSNDPRFRPEVEKYFDESTRSVLCVPLRKESEVSPGLLVIINKRFGRFTPEDEELALAVADQISVVLRDAELLDRVRNLKNYNDRILETIGAGVLTFDKFGKLATINRAGAELLGFRPHESIGKDYTSLFDHAAGGRLSMLTEDALIRQRRLAAYDVRFLRPDGASRSLNLNALPLRDRQGDLLGGVLVAEDITKEQRLMNTLCRYMSREVAEHVMQDQEKLKLGGTRTEVSILFTDIRNFTALSEQMDPWDVVNLLNAYFPRMINIIFRHQGMVDKFIGDAILAVFGVPMPREDDALRAVQAAMEMRKELDTIHKERARQGLTTVEMGIGITSGTVISGNIGSERRMDYTVIGDPVNLATRLEGLTKEVKYGILVNEHVRKAIGRAIPCESLGSFSVKGKREKVPVYAIKTSHQLCLQGDESVK